MSDFKKIYNVPDGYLYYKLDLNVGLTSNSNVCKANHLKRKKKRKCDITRLNWLELVVLSVDGGKSNPPTHG